MPVPRTIKFLASLWAGALRLRTSLSGALQSLVKQDENSSKHTKQHAEVSDLHRFPEPSAARPVALLATGRAVQARGATQEAQVSQ